MQVRDARLRARSDKRCAQAVRTASGRAARRALDLIELRDELDATRGTLRTRTDLNRPLPHMCSPSHAFV